MKILIAHVNYRLRGGEDAVVDAEARILSEAGHDVSVCATASATLDSLPFAARAGVAADPAYPPYGRALIAEALSECCADVVHFHNIFPLIGVSGVAFAGGRGAATVRTLHNWRLSCLAGTHLIDGNPCHRCRPGNYGPGIVRGCYRGSVPMSLEMARFCRADWEAAKSGLYDEIVTVNCAIRDAYVGAGLHEDTVRVKHNSVDEVGPSGERASRVVYVGRLSEEKGVNGLVTAWPESACELLVVGDGPLAESLKTISKPNVKFTGEVSEEQVAAYLSESAGLVVPSVGHEGPPVVLLKALAAATPVVAFRGPVIGDVVSYIDSSLVVDPGDYEALVSASCRLVPYSRGLGLKALTLFHERFTHARNRAALESVYADAAARRDERTLRR